MMNLLGDCLRLDHPNVVRVLGCGCNREERLAFLIMEHVDGTNLRSYVEELGDNLTVGGALQLITQVAEGLDEIHASNLIHRDIKPDNIFVSRQTGIAKIGDFGLSVTLLDFADRLDVGRDAYGTPAFVAPEQIIGTAFDRRVDIYSFAMTVYYILTGVVAYDYRTERELLYAHIHQDPVMPSRRNSSWPEALDAALARSLSKHPERRHLNALTLAREVQRALEAFTPLRLSSFRHGTLAPQSSTEVSIKGVRI
jgi:serine/threonine protein kinase